VPIIRGFFTGTTPIALSQSGLPAGANFADNGDGSYTVFGTWPPQGSYPYAVTAVNAVGSTTVPGNALNSIAEALTLNTFTSPGYCAVANSPGIASYFILLQPNGSITTGTNTQTSTNMPNAWHNGSAVAADYELRLTPTVGLGPVSGTPNVWIPLSSSVSFIYERTLPGEDLNGLLLEIRYVPTNTIVDSVSFCQQVGVDVFCSPC
jgi:hypothetical protein